MRLLKLKDDGEFSLIEFIGDNIPRYAILSHTWGADSEEVTFKDLMKGIGKSKAGYQKIRFCGQQAATDGLQYFWVDTCCIDKSSSAELSEAINSMFRWYHDAGKCYVYLSDVSISGSIKNDQFSQWTWEPAFQKSKWFTRGWTLQELIGPASVEFFSVEGVRLGDKKLLEPQIHEITGITAQALQGDPLSHFSVNERMSWAAKRATKREEDAVYSLLGIFDIHMPLIYGEGREKALVRLRKEIEESLKDKSPAFTQEEKDCLQSLSFIDLETRQHAIATALFNTSTWIFKRPEFLDWVERRNISEHKGLLWIKGKPGSGKSVMMKHIQTQISQPSSVIINFFFNARGGPLEKTPLGLFRSLLHQLLQRQRHLLSKFLPTYRAKRDTLQSGWEWQEGELREYFSHVVKSAKVSSMFVFIDALDECEEESDEYEEESGVRRVVSFFAELTSSAVSSGCRFHVCISSRHYPQITVPGCLEIFMENCNVSDISKYVQSKLCLQDAPGMDFQEEVVKKASGVFLWVVLVVRSLLEKKDEGGTIKQMRRILQLVPKKLDNLFTGYFKAVNAEDRQRTRSLMQWILFAERPLTPMEIHCALAFSVERPPKSQKSWQQSDDYSDEDTQIERGLRTLSKGLVEITQANPGGGDSDNEDSAPGRIQGNCRVQFIHESVRDFLLHHDGLQLIDPGLGQSAVGKSHDQLTKACIGYLSIEELQIDLSSDIYVKNYDGRHHAAAAVVDSYRKYVFWDYAVRSVFKHATKAEYERTEQRHLAQLFHWDPQPVFHIWRYFSDCLSTTEYKDTQGLGTVFLHVASESGLTTCVSDLLDRGVDVNIRGGQYFCALAAAASNGHETTARVLLEKGADVKAQDGNGKTALHRAAINGHEATARLLLEKGADVKAQDENGKTALYRAAINGHEATARLLLEKGADVKTQDKNGRTALHWAAANGHEATARLLLKKGADVKAQNGNGGTVLHWAAANGHEAIARLLLEKGADVKTQDKNGWTALYWADWNGHEATERLLLEKGADVKAQDGNGGTGLHRAVWSGYEATARLLLEKGAYVKAQDGNGETALYWAVVSGYEAIERLLLEKGADVKAQDGNGETALYRAVVSGHETTERLLLEKGANVKAQDGNGETALYRAAASGQETIARLLLEKWADVKAQDKNEKTALYRAAVSGHEAIARLLLEKGDVKAQDGNGKTALYWAAANGQRR